LVQSRHGALSNLQKKAAWVGMFISVSMPLRLKCSLGAVEELQWIIFVQDLLNLVAVRCIKCTCKVGNQTIITRVKEEDNEQ
jgi:hypothetical protein